MKRNYVALHSIPAAPAVGGMRRGVAAKARPRNIAISIAPASDLPKLLKDETVQAIAPSLPMRLIKAVDKKSGGASNGSVAWGVKAVGAHDCPFDGEGIVVAVLDTGINTDHPAFKGVQFEQKDFTGEGVQDDDGHGTHCAGTIFGRKVGKTRIGVAPGVKRALNGKVLGSEGASSDSIVDAVNWAVQNGAHVISMSLGMDFPGYVKELTDDDVPADLATSMALDGYRQNIILFERLATLLRARTQPSLIVAASGNESRRDIKPSYRIAVSPPAASEGIISVAALGVHKQGWQVAEFSNSLALISGPGVDIESASHTGGLTTMSGTSMAAPHVAGIAALWAQKLQAKKLLDPIRLQSSVLGSGKLDRIFKFDPVDVGSGMAMAPIEK